MPASSPAAVRWHRAGGLLVGAAIAAGAACSGSAPAADASPLDRADVYSSAFRPAPDDLIPGKEAIERAEALALYYKGLRLQRAGDPEGALAVFRDVLELDPANLRLAIRTANQLARYGRFNEALAVLEDSLAANPDQPGAYINISQYCATYHNESEAIRAKAYRYAREALEKFPRDASVYGHLATLYLEDAKRDQAVETVEKALAQDVPDPAFWIALARIADDVWPLHGSHSAPGHRDRINASYERALRHGGGDRSIARTVAAYYGRSGQPDKAADIYRDLVAEQPSDLDARERLAAALRAAGDPQGALQALEDLVSINPHDADIRERLGDYYVEQEMTEPAIRHYLESVRLGKTSAGDFSRLADLMVAADQTDEAVKLLERAAFLYPNDPRFPYKLAIMLHDAGRHEEAADAFARTEKTAREVYPDMLDAKFYFFFGAAAEQAEQFDRAADLLRKSIDLAPEDAHEFAAEAYNYLGYMWLEQEIHIDEAGELIRYANQLVEDNGAFVDSLGWYHFLKGDYEAARRELQRASDLLERPDPVVLDHLAQAHYKLGDLGKAVALLRAAADLEGAPPEVAERRDQYAAEASAQGVAVPDEPLPLQKSDAPAEEKSDESAAPAPADAEAA